MMSHSVTRFSPVIRPIDALILFLSILMVANDVANIRIISESSTKDDRLFQSVSLKYNPSEPFGQKFGQFGQM